MVVNDEALILLLVFFFSLNSSIVYWNLSQYNEHPVNDKILRETSSTLDSKNKFLWGQLTNHYRYMNKSCVEEQKVIVNIHFLLKVACLVYR